MAFIACLTTHPGVAADQERPNVLLIMADDLGFSDLGCYGGEIQTPNLDALAAHGVRMTQFYNTGRCWPTRGSLLTGHYAPSIRRDDVPGKPGLGGGSGKRPTWSRLLPQLLRSAGYRSYHTGKWHLDRMPVASGFDHSYYLKDQGRFFSPQVHYRDDERLAPVERPTKKAEEKSIGYYATTALADHAIEVLQDHHNKHADVPFFHYLAFSAPHFPLHAMPGDIAKYSSTYARGWDAVRSQRWKKMRTLGLLGQSVERPSRPEPDLGPPYHFPDAMEKLGRGEVNRPVPWSQLNAEQQKFQSSKMAIHAAMVHRMDMEIGRVIETLRESNELENTLVMFLSDNGASAEIMVRSDGHDPNAMPGSADSYLCLGPGWSTVCNTPMRRHKTWTHEGGISTPMVVSWPARMKTNGELRHGVGHVIDIVPTILDAAHVEIEGLIPNNAPEYPGKSLLTDWSTTHDDAAIGTKLADRALWWFHDGHRAIRVGDWKAVAPIAEPWELYDMSRDRGEAIDRAIPNRPKLEELVAAWENQATLCRHLATQDLSDEDLPKAARHQRNPKMSAAQEAARPKRQQHLLHGETHMINGRHAFVMLPEDEKLSDAANQAKDKPWVFYGPTLKRYPDVHESWMHQKLLDAGVAVAGIDVGECYGSPHALPHFDALYQFMVDRGFSRRPVLLGRSRGGLWVTRWAISHPDRVSGIGGIYPVYDLTTYPGIDRAAGAYGLTPAELEQQIKDLNPIESVHSLAAADIPVHIIHGLDDHVVPIDPNSLRLKETYDRAGKGHLVHVDEIAKQGHNFWPGFFQDEALVKFMITRAKGTQK